MKRNQTIKIRLYDGRTGKSIKPEKVLADLIGAFAIHQRHDYAGQRLRYVVTHSTSGLRACYARTKADALKAIRAFRALNVDWDSVTSIKDSLSWPKRTRARAQRIREKAEAA